MTARETAERQVAIARLALDGVLRGRERRDDWLLACVRLQDALLALDGVRDRERTTTEAR